jgi:hypothetical protein
MISKIHGFLAHFSIGQCSDLTYDEFHQFCDITKSKSLREAAEILIVSKFIKVTIISHFIDCIASQANPITIAAIFLRI